MASPIPAMMLYHQPDDGFILTFHEVAWTGAAIDDFELKIRP